MAAVVALVRVEALPSCGFIGGIIFWGVVNTALEETNRLEFCISCHMPRDWVHMLVRKIQASEEVYGKITGFVDTPEKLEAHHLPKAYRDPDEEE